jgi:hypothetical protein
MLLDIIYISIAIVFVIIWGLEGIGLISIALFAYGTYGLIVNIIKKRQYGKK